MALMIEGWLAGPRSTLALSGDGVGMNARRLTYSIASLLLFVTAAPFWLYLCTMLPRGTGFGGSPMRFFITPVVLTAIAFSIRHLIRDKPSALGISILLSPIVVILFLLLAKLLAA